MHHVVASSPVMQTANVVVPCEQEEEATGDAVPMPELQHNLRLLVDLAEADIRKIDARLRHAQDTAVLLGREQVCGGQSCLFLCLLSSHRWRAR